MPLPFVDQERDDRIVALTRQGLLTTAEIAAIVGCTTRTVHRCRARRDVRLRPANVALSETELAFADALLSDGASYGEVARTLGRASGTAISRRLPGRSVWKQGSGAVYARLTRQLESL